MLKMNSTLKKSGKKHSTPVLCSKNLELYFPLSEIRRGDTSTLRNAIYSDSDDAEKKSKQTVRRKRIKNKNSCLTIDNINSSSSDSEYETLYEIDVNCSNNEQQITSPLRKKIENFYENEISSANNVEQITSPLRKKINFYESTHSNSDVRLTQVVIASPRPSELFYSPTQDIRKHYNESLNSEESPLRLQYWNSPEYQRKFKDPTQYRSYSGPGRKERLSPSKISFSPKWENPVPSKYSSPSQIPPIVYAQSRTSPVRETRRPTSGSGSRNSYWNRCKIVKAPFSEKKKRVECGNRIKRAQTYHWKKPLEIFSEESCGSVSMIPVGGKKQSDERKLPIRSAMQISCNDSLAGSTLQKTNKVKPRNCTADHNQRGESVKDDDSFGSSESIISRSQKSNSIQVISNIKITDGRYKNFLKKLF